MGEVREVVGRQPWMLVVVGGYVTISMFQAGSLLGFYHLFAKRQAFIVVLLLHYSEITVILN